MAMQHAAIAFQALEGHDWDTVVATCVRAETVGPILMPTEYRAGMGNLKMNQKVAEATRLFVDTMRDLMGDALQAHKEVQGMIDRDAPALRETMRVPGYGTSVSINEGEE